MPIEELDLDGFIKFLKQKQGDLQDAQYAATLGVPRQHLWDVYNGRKLPGNKIAQGLASMNVGVTRNVSISYQVDTEEPKKEKK